MKCVLGRYLPCFLSVCRIFWDLVYHFLTFWWTLSLEKEMATHSSILAWKNPMDRGAWWTRVHGVAKELDRTEWLNSNHSWLCCHTGALLKTHSEYKWYLINFHSCQVTCIYNTTKISKYANTVFIQLKKIIVVSLT